MKTATLTIEVPDDFEKGDCHECLLSYITDDWDVRCALMHGYRDCPLEIQEKPLDLCKTCTNIKYCGKRRRIGIMLACSDYKGE